MKFILTIPAYNEERYLRETVETIISWTTAYNARHEFLIIIANNGSEDKTQQVAEELSKKHPMIIPYQLTHRGKGRAIYTSWTMHDGDAYLFTDADLAYGTDILTTMVSDLETGNDVAVASRMAPGASHHQKPIRRVSTYLYNAALHSLFKHSFTDAQAGCKGLSKHAAKTLLPVTREDSWFFDTRLLLEAERAGFTIKEIPTKNNDSRPRFPNIVVAGYLIYKMLLFRATWKKKTS